MQWNGEHADYLIKQELNSINQEDKQKFTTASSFLYCSTTCNKSCLYDGALKRRIRAHTVALPYICAICKKSFSLAQNVETQYTWELTLESDLIIIEFAINCFHDWEVWKRIWELTLKINFLVVKFVINCFFLPKVWKAHKNLHWKTTFLLLGLNSFPLAKHLKPHIWELIL